MDRVDLFSGHLPNPSQHKFPEPEYLQEEIALKGYCIIPGRMNPSEVETARREIDRLLEAQESLYGPQELQRINDHGVVRSPFLDSKFLREKCFDSLVLGLLDRVFGEQVVLHVNRAVVSDSKLRHPATVWHREPPYVDFTASRILALTFAQMVDESNERNGGMAVLPGSHLWERFPSDEYVRRNAVIPEIPSGALLVFNSLLFHCGTPNRGSASRRSMVSIFTVPVIKQQVNLPKMLRARGCEEIAHEIPRGDFLLGFTTELRDSDDEYRRRKMDAQERARK